MSTRSCLFVASADASEAGRTLAARARSLERFYEPCGLAGASLSPLEGNAWVGAFGVADPLSPPVCWGAPFGAAAASPDSVFASDEALRRTMVGLGAAVAWRGETLRIVTAPAGPAGLYFAEGPGIRVWATHAVAAAYLATGGVTIDADAIPELVAFDFVGSTRTMVRDVVPVGPAMRIDVISGTVSEACYWPSAERWAAVPEAEAHDHTAEALLESLERRIGSGHAGLALTAGADSRVLAVGLHELGKSTKAFCWGEPGWPDVEGARRVAEALGMDFAARAQWRSDADLGRIFDAEARWSDGRLILSPAEREWPAGVDAIALGAAGEVGRTFYYRRHVREPEPSDPDGLARFLRAQARLSGADAAAHAAAGASVSAWLARAAESGHTGWRLLDVLYAEQRVGCWGRIQVPALDADIVAGFSPQEVVRGLASLPLAERAADGFHRRFVAERRPDLALPDPAPPSPSPRWRRALARAGRVFRSAAPPAPRGDPLLRELWEERPHTRAWVAEEVLGSPLIAGTLGDGWADTTRVGFLAGRRRACEQAAVAAAPVALEAALRDLA